MNGLDAAPARSNASRPAVVRAAAVVRKPVSSAALLQPREMPAMPEAPDVRGREDPEEEAGGEGDFVEGGVVGGVVGGVAGGVADGMFGGEARPPAAAPAARPPRKFDATMTAPVLVSAPPLEYTPQAAEAEVEGTMVVECVVAVDGTIHACRVLASLPYMDRTVISNLERRRYRPATLQGQPLPVRYTFAIKFRLPD